MPLVKNLWDNEVRLKLCIAAIKPMNFTPTAWDNICKELGPAYSAHHCKKEWKVMMKNDAGEQNDSMPYQDSSPRQTPDQPATPPPKKRSKKKSKGKKDKRKKTEHGEIPSIAETGATEEADPQLAQDTLKLSKRPKTPKVVEQSDKSAHDNQRSANLGKKIRRSERNEESDDDKDDDRSSTRPRKQQKLDDPSNDVEVDSTSNNATNNPSVRAGNNNNTNSGRSLDSYRPSYPSGQPLYRSDQPGLVIQPKSRPSTPYHNNVPRGPKIPEVEILDTRPRPQISQTAQLYSHANARQHGVPQGTPNGPKNQHAHQNRSNQPSEARTPGFYQSGRPDPDYGGRTPSYRTNADSGQFHGSKTPRPNQEPQYNQRQSYNGQEKSHWESATGGRHYHFKDEYDNGLFVSPEGHVRLSPTGRCWESSSMKRTISQDQDLLEVEMMFLGKQSKKLDCSFKVIIPVIGKPVNLEPSLGSFNLPEHSRRPNTIL